MVNGIGIEPISSNLFGYRQKLGYSHGAEHLLARSHYAHAVRLVAPNGFEPLFPDPESRVLPLNERAIIYFCTNHELPHGVIFVLANSSSTAFFTPSQS